MNETRITDISIAPDGRIYVFGASWQVLELLSDLDLGDADLRQRTEFLRKAAAQAGGDAGLCRDLTSILSKDDRSRTGDVHGE